MLLDGWRFIHPSIKFFLLGKIISTNEYSKSPEDENLRSSLLLNTIESFI